MTVTAVASSPSRRIAAEVRAEAARQGLSLRKLALRMEGVSHAWVTRRVSIESSVDITFEDLDRLAEALGVPVVQLLEAAHYAEVPPGNANLDEGWAA